MAIRRARYSRLGIFGYTSLHKWLALLVLFALLLGGLALLYRGIDDAMFLVQIVADELRTIPEHGECPPNGSRLGFLDVIWEVDGTLCFRGRSTPALAIGHSSTEARIAFRDFQRLLTAPGILIPYRDFRLALAVQAYLQLLGIKRTSRA